MSTRPRCRSGSAGSAAPPGSRCCRPAAFSTPAPLAEGGLARSASSDLTERTRIDLIERTERIRHGSARARLLAVIAMVFGLVDARHAEFYTSLHPELVAFAHRMRSLHERRTAPRAGSVDTA